MESDTVSFRYWLSVPQQGMRFAFEDKETVSSFTVYPIAGIKIVVTGDRPGGIARKQLPSG